MTTPITPETKVAELLDAYPELESVLIELAPPFRKLKNPILRRTIARVTTLEKAAAVADLPLRELIDTLRRAAGQTVLDTDPRTGNDRAAGDGDGAAEWVDPSRVVWTIDADALLESGTQPINEILRRAKALDPGGLGLVRSSFRPAPLIELLEQRGYRTAVVDSGEQFATFVAQGTVDSRITE